MDEERMSAMNIFQKLVALRGAQGYLRNHSDDTPTRELLLQLERELKPQIIAWGGIPAIDAWVDQNDSGHNKPSQLEEIDWEWLGEENK